MDTLDKYISKEFLVYFAILLVGLAALYLGIDLFSKFWKLPLSTDKVFLLYLYKIPEACQQFLPVACLMACLLVLTNMSRQREVLALYAGGVSTLRLASTFIAIVSLICTVSFLVFDNVGPVYSKKRILLRNNQTSTDITHFDPTRFWYRSGQMIYNVGMFYPGDNTMENLNIYVLDAKFRMIERVWAAQAVYNKEKQDWLLSDGFVVSYPPENNYPISGKFEKKWGVIPEEPSDFTAFQIHVDTMGLKELRQYITRNSNYGLNTIPTQVKYHERIAMVFTPLIFVLLGIPFGTKPLQTQTMGRSVGYCFLMVFIYLLMFRFALTIGKGGHIPPMLSGWMTNILFLVYAGFKLWKK